MLEVNGSDMSFLCFWLVVLITRCWKGLDAMAGCVCVDIYIYIYTYYIYMFYISIRIRTYSYIYMYIIVPHIIFLLYINITFVLV